MNADLVTHVVGETPTGKIRTGSQTNGRYLQTDEFHRINVFETASGAQRGRFDSERKAHIAGVVELAVKDNPQAWTDPDHAVAALGESLFTNGLLGVDLLAVPPRAGFPPHVHPGHHLLMCVRGAGTFTLDGVVHDVVPGDLYMVEGGIPHAVGNPNDTPHVLLAFGAPPKELDSHDRMTVVEWDGTPVQTPA